MKTLALLRTCVLTTAGLLFAAHFTAADDLYVVKLLTNPRVGKEAIVERTETTRVQVKLSELDGSNVFQKHNETKTTRFKYRQKTVQQKSDDGPPDVMHCTYETARQTVNGKEETLAFEGKTVVVTRKGTAHRFSYQGGADLDKEALETLKEHFDDDAGKLDDWLGKKAVHINEERPLNREMFLKGFAKVPGMKLDEASFKGTWKLTKVYRKGERQFGTLDLRIDVPIRTLASAPAADPAKSEITPLEKGATLKLNLQLDACIDGSSATGTTEAEMKLQGASRLPPDAATFLSHIFVETKSKISLIEEPKGER